MTEIVTVVVSAAGLTTATVSRRLYSVDIVDRAVTAGPWTAVGAQRGSPIGLLFLLTKAA